MDTVVVRKVNSSEFEALQAIGHQSFLESFGEQNTESNMALYLGENFSLEKIKSELRHEESLFYFAELGDEVIGYLKLNRGQAQTEIISERAVEIERIYVLSEFHGKRIGLLLYQKALEVASHYSADWLWLGVWEKNIKAINFYQKCGFQEFDKHTFYLGSDKQTDIMMKVELNNNDSSQD